MPKVKPLNVYIINGKIMYDLIVPMGIRTFKYFKNETVKNMESNSNMNDKFV